MSSEKFIEVLEPKIDASGVGLSVANVRAAGKAAGLKTGFAIQSDIVSGKEWVDLYPMILVLVDTVRKQNLRLKLLESKLKDVDGNIEGLTNFTQLFKEVTIEDKEEQVNTENE